MKKFAVLLAISVSAIAAASAFGSSKTVVGTGHTSLGTVLVDSHGHTLYLFEGDTSKRLGCNGSCLTSWIPVSAKASATGSAKASALGTIKRGSSSQVTYSGHPLYAFVGDTKTGQGHRPRSHPERQEVVRHRPLRCGDDRERQGLVRQRRRIGTSRLVTAQRWAGPLPQDPPTSGPSRTAPIIGHARIGGRPPQTPEDLPRGSAARGQRCDPRPRRAARRGSGS
jgi:predicted lipoprotein with Yx(FWY)xxD motif